VLLRRLCSQMEVPPQSLHLALSRLCSQMEAPPQSLHRALRFLCSQMLLPPQSTHWLLRRPCGHFVVGPPAPHLPACRFPLAPALSALAPLLAMPTRALYPASASATAPSFSVSVLSLLRLALALVLNALGLLGGLASLGGPRSLGIDTYLIPEPMGTCVEMLWFWSQNPWEINSFLAFALSRVVGKG
jgi:hypothetical protein